MWLAVVGGGVFVCVTGCGGQGYWEDVTDYHFDVSPSGEKVVFTAAGKGGRDLYLLEIGSRRIHPLTTSDHFEREGRFLSEDKVVVSAVANPRRPWSAVHLYLLEVPTKKATPLTTDSDAADVHVVPVGDSAALFNRIRLQRGIARVLDIGGSKSEGFYWCPLQTGAEQAVLDPFALAIYNLRAVFQDRRQLLLDNEFDDRHGVKVATLSNPIGTGQVRVVKEQLLVKEGYRAVLSPDERHIYFVREGEGKRFLIQLDLRTRQETVLAVRNRYILEMRARGRWLFWLEGTRPDVTVYGASLNVTLWRMDTQSRRLEPLLLPHQFTHPSGALP